MQTSGIWTVGILLRIQIWIEYYRMFYVCQLDIVETKRIVVVVVFIVAYLYMAPRY